MSIGDALKDMPDGYREYVEDIQGGKIAVGLDNEDPLISLGDSEAGLLFDSEVEHTQFRFNDGKDLLWLEGGHARIRQAETPGRFVVNIARGIPTKVNGWDYHTVVGLGTRGILNVRGVDKDYGGEAHVSGYDRTGTWFQVKSSDITQPEQSEADKAIADGKPRWVCHEQLGWQSVFVLRKDYTHAKPLLVYREANDRIPDESPMMTMAIATEILPFGDSPPPAEPEEHDAEHSAGILRQKLEHAKKHQYLVAVGYTKEGKMHFFSGVIRCIIDDVTVSFREPLDIDLASVRSVDIVIADMPTAEPEGRSNILGHQCYDSEPAYVPDPVDNAPTFVFQIHEAHGPLCSGCDSHTEARSVPDGIEQWCPVCNVKVDPDWKRQSDENIRHQKVMNWQSHDWARRPADMNKNWDEIEMICLECGIRSKYGKHQECHQTVRL